MRVHARGIDVLDNPQINRGTAFTVEERKHLGLTGMLPSTVESLEQQVGRTYAQFLDLGTDIEKWSFLTGVHDTNEVLFYALLD